MTTFHACKAEGSSIGEFIEPVFREKVFRGELQQEDFYWHEGMADWTPVSNYRAAQKTIVRAAAMPPPLPVQVKAVPPGAKICTNCGYIGKPVAITKGSFAVELLLWLLFLVPGLLYSLWRLASRYSACPKCEAPNMIPANSPLAQKFLAR
jgi:hypothetical protein